MAGGHKDGGEFGRDAAWGRREVEEGGDGEVGLGVEEDLLNADAGDRGLAEDLGVQRGAGGQRADEAEHGGADLALAGFGLGAGVDLGDAVVAGLGLVVGGGVEQADELVTGLGARAQDEGEGGDEEEERALEHGVDSRLVIA